MSSIFRNSPTSIYKPTTPAVVSTESSALASNQRVLIIILAIILFFSLVGPNSYAIFGNLINYLIQKVGEVITYFAANLGYTTGSIINTATNVTSNATISGVQIADGALNSVGDIFRESNNSRVSPTIKKEMDEMTTKSQNFLLLPNGKTPEQIRAEGGSSLAPGDASAGLRRDLDDVINRMNKLDQSLAKNDSTESSIQKPISASKAGWCLVGEFQSKRGCASVNAGDICNSGKLYATKEQCMQGGISGSP